MGQTLIELGSRQLARYLLAADGASQLLSSLSSSMTGRAHKHDGTRYDLALHRHRQLVCVTQLGVMDDKAGHARPTGSEQ